jgi:hypothetical protein
MKTKQAISGSVAVAAMISYWIAHAWQKSCRRHQAEQARLMQEAVDTFEGEGGLVVS